MQSARTIMTADPYFLQSGMTLKEAVQALVEKGYSSAPVINPLGDVMGIFSEIALIRALILHKVKSTNEDKVAHYQELFDPITYVDETSDIPSVMRAVLQSSVRRVLVRGPKGNVVGIVSPKDILKDLGGVQTSYRDLKNELETTKKSVVDLTRANASLSKDLTQYFGFFENSPMMMHSTDKDGKIILANSTIHEVLKYDPGELLGKPVLALYAPTVHPQVKKALETLKNGGTVPESYTTMVNKRGEMTRVDILTSPIVDDAGKFIATVSVSRTIDSDILLRLLNGIDPDADPSKYSGVK